MNDRLTRASAGMAVIAAGATLTGCGWTPRDQLAHDRSLSYSPLAGDGTAYAEVPALSQSGIEVSRAGLTISDTIP